MKILDVIEMETKDTSGRLFTSLHLEYETHQGFTNTVPLQKEIDEIWAWLKKDAEHRGLKDAAIHVVEASKADSHPSTNGLTFSFKRKSDGSWTSSH